MISSIQIFFEPPDLQDTHPWCGGRRVRRETDVPPVLGKERISKIFTAAKSVISVSPLPTNATCAAATACPRERFSGENIQIS
jgi:hypothetical protein